MSRIILHIDLDSFYASLEEKRHPELKGKAVVVCVFSGRTENSGAVATANYAARELGIKAGIYIAEAKKLANKDTIFLPTDIEFYKETSERIMEILREYGSKFEQRSIDEAYLDISDCGSFDQAKKLAEKIKKEVSEEEGITCSVGIGPSKLVAKMASKVQKPNGLTIIKPDEVKAFLNPLPVRKLFGIGPKSMEVFDNFGIKTIGELANFDVKKLVAEFGENKGREISERANGIDNNEVEETEKQQLSKIGTLKENTNSLETISEKLEELSVELEKKIRKEGLKFKTVSVILITTRLQTLTRAKTLSGFTDDIETMKKEFRELVKEFLTENPQEKLRRCGVRVSNFDRDPKVETKTQKTLFSFGK
ncbi:MAG: DNA polymerase IV [Candidatus Aenigmarchaeota archaeon]|nr:DNA polymerase IV [Candidatus Aenigmarchaeota archaeon]